MKRRPGAGRPPLENPPQVYHITLRLYPGLDGELQRWIDAIPPRYRAAAVKARLLAGPQHEQAFEDGQDLDALLDSLML